MKTFETVRGMRDFLPDDLVKRRIVEDKVRNCFQLYGYEEIETPVLESFDLVNAKAGDEIRHRLYAFEDLGGRKIVMRPEMTASVARLVTSKFRTEAKPIRLGYIANCFRYDNPQMGRYREFWQAGFELFGSKRAEADAEIVTAFYHLMRTLGFRDFTIKVGHVGILRGLLGAEGIGEQDQNVVMGLLDRKRIKKALALLEQLKVSENCRKNVDTLLSLSGTDYLNILAKGRRILSLNDEALVCLNNLEKIVKFSVDGGVTASILVDLGFTRGLEYYTGMIFEVYVPNLNIALGGGGRYDGLVELLGGESTPAVGSSPGIDRLVLAMEKEILFPMKTTQTRVLVVPITEKLLNKALKVATEIRRIGLSTEVEVLGRDIRSALSYADKKSFSFAVIVGSREIERDSVIVRNMLSKVQREVPLLNLAAEFDKN